ncbi:hypothetical protein WJX72_003686 [[Myrmecia] bisecta]|uniref:Uncharacterized protein n=1 Tax=[Myrmecia] bisecta TaxID=41462 RepID=A0AAW1R6G7_9CHLO
MDAPYATCTAPHPARGMAEAETPGLSTEHPIGERFDNGTTKESLRAQWTQVVTALHFCYVEGDSFEGITHLNKLRTLTLDSQQYRSNTDTLDLTPLLSLTALETLQLELPTQLYHTLYDEDGQFQHIENTPYEVFLSQLHKLPALRNLHLCGKENLLHAIRPGPQVVLHMELTGLPDTTQIASLPWLPSLKHLWLKLERQHWGSDDEGNVPTLDMARQGSKALLKRRLWEDYRLAYAANWPQH